MNRGITILLSWILLLEVIGLGVLSQSVGEIWIPSQAESTDFIIHEGDPFRKVVSLVAEVSQDSPELPLMVYGVFNGLDRQIKRGRYKFEAGWSPVQVLEQTAVGPNDPLRVKILPGYTLHDCASVLKQAGWIHNASAWIEVASPESKVGIRTFEGLLAAETYFFEEPNEPQTVLLSLHDNWKKFITRIAGTSDLGMRLRNGLTLYDTIILASIIEKEAAKPPEMATAASVFHNRLRKNWPLGSAATLRYALRDWEGRDDQLPVSLKSPYNTSKRPGLPPTPICIPSEAALLASISPPETRYLFFSGDGDGSLVFNKTHDGHKTSVSRYRKKIDKREQEAAKVRIPSSTTASPIQ